MKKKELEILLQKIPSFDNPLPHLEQYNTSASIVADIIFTAHQLGDIDNKIILDLGCGTGIFSIGAFLTGAKKVIGIDIDNNIINIARKYAEKNNFKIIFKVQDVKDVDIKCDTVLMNPPFGAQKGNQNADRKFIEKGFEVATVLYSLHLTKTVPFINKLIYSLRGNINYSKNYILPIKRTFNFHKKKTSNFDVTLLRIETSR
jgi:putative methylase